MIIKLHESRRRRNTLENVQHKKNLFANRTPEKKECSGAVNYSPIMLKTVWSCWGRHKACRSALEWEMSSCSFWQRNSPSTGTCLGILCCLRLSFRWLLSCISSVDLLFTNGSDAGFENLWLRRSKVTKVTKFIFLISKQCNRMLAIYYCLNAIKGRGKPNIFIRFMI